MSEVPISVPAGSNNILLLAPSQVEANVCTGLYRSEDPEDIRCITITYLDDAGDRSRRWRTNQGSLPTELVVVEAGGNRGTAGKRESRDTVEVLREPADDLTWLGIHANEYLTRWFDLDDEIVLCLDSLSVMLQYVETERAYKFLHVLTSRVEQADALAHYHMDPSVHDDQTINLLKQLCDTAIEYDPETDEWSVMTR